ncbi:hypothetical protein SLEP1_g59279 [Rubroshorea leprosula]|uniref:Uncharacterized protein n=1 Tax=Rubroshorea leprosula TaxID=152421 RepID=A0AAV5MRU4_9ROSI|nr:hypothetical protein SLEP1_g59279 [Rubroshorea leprosula]
MSGRAGCRGIDEQGICILMVDEKLEPSTAKLMLKGSADSLNGISDRWTGLMVTTCTLMRWLDF